MSADRENLLALLAEAREEASSTSASLLQLMREMSALNDAALSIRNRIDDALAAEIGAKA